MQGSKHTLHHSILTLVPCREVLVRSSAITPDRAYLPRHPLPPKTTVRLSVHLAPFPRPWRNPNLDTGTRQDTRRCQTRKLNVFAIPTPSPNSTFRTHASTLLTTLLM